MSEEDDLSDLTTVVVANAIFVRKARKLCDKRIKEEVKKSPFTEWEVSELLRFAYTFMNGDSKEVVFAKFNISKELADQLENQFDLGW